MKNARNEEVRNKGDKERGDKVGFLFLFYFLED